MNEIPKTIEQLNDEFFLNAVKDMPFMGEVEIQKWVNRCKNEVKLSAPRHDGDDVYGWVDECEAWLWKTTENKINFSSRDIGHFRWLIKSWLDDYYQNC